MSRYLGRYPAPSRRMATGGFVLPPTTGPGFRDPVTGKLIGGTIEQLSPVDPMTKPGASLPYPDYGGPVEGPFKDPTGNPMPMPMLPGSGSIRTPMPPGSPYRGAPDDPGLNDPGGPPNIVDPVAPPPLPIGQSGQGTFFDPVKWRPTIGPGELNPNSFFNSARQGLPYSVGKDWQFEFGPSMAPGDIQNVKDEFWNWYPHRGAAASPITSVLDNLPGSSRAGMFPGIGGDPSDTGQPAGGGSTPAAPPADDATGGAPAGGRDTPDVVGSATGAGRSGLQDAIDQAVTGINSPTGRGLTTAGGLLGAVAPPVGLAALGINALGRLGSFFGFGSHPDPPVGPRAEDAFQAQREGEREAPTAPPTAPPPDVGPPPGPPPGVDVNEGPTAGTGGNSAGANSGETGEGGGDLARGGFVPRRTRPVGGSGSWKGAPKFARGGQVAKLPSRAQRVQQFESKFGKAAI
jgi:hypothetical protein